MDGLMEIVRVLLEHWQVLTAVVAVLAIGSTLAGALFGLAFRIVVRRKSKKLPRQQLMQFDINKDGDIVVKPIRFHND